MDVARHEVQVNGHPVRYQVMGVDRDPLVLVHGLPGSGEWWRRNLRALAKRHRVYLVDLPGFGAMRRSLHRFVLSDAPSWLLAWMDAIGLGRAHLAGHSMGGLICLRFAARNPQAVRRLALVAPAGVPSGRSILGHLIPLIATLRHTSPAFLPVLAHDALRAGPLTLLRTVRDLLAEDLRGDLESITAPTLLVWGEKDALIPPTAGLLLRERIADSRILIMEGAGHVPMFEQPREFESALLAFLAGRPVGE